MASYIVKVATVENYLVEASSRFEAVEKATAEAKEGFVDGVKRLDGPGIVISVNPCDGD